MIFFTFGASVTSMVSGWFADLALAVGGLVGVLTIIDTMMPCNVKQQIKRKVEDLWLVLAAQQSGYFIGPMLKIRVQIVLTLFAYFATLGLTFYFQIVPIEMAWNALFILAIFILASSALILHLFVLRKLSTVNRLSIFILRLATISLLLLGCQLLTAGILYYFDLLSPRNRSTLYVIITQTKLLQAIPVISALVVAGVAWVEGNLLMLLFMGTLAWLALTAVLMGLIRIFQYIIFQIAAYDKGPILALAALLTGVGGILKFFG